MMAWLLCLVAFGLTVAVGRISLRGGFVLVMAVGYVYGIVRANLNEPGAHFTFDASVLGLYVAYFSLRRRDYRPERARALMPWMLVLAAWPVFMFFLPIQNLFVQLVGLRAAILFLPFLVIGTQISEDDLRFVTIGLAILNLFALVFAGAEFFYGVEAFYPKNALTDLIYRSRVLDSAAALRIPATFTGAHAYASTMVGTLPWLVEAWTRTSLRRWQTYLVPLAIGAAYLGVFLSATRTHLIIALVLLLVMVLSLKLKPSVKFAVVVMFVVVMYFGLQDGRVERLNTLQDVDTVTQRFHGSVNTPLLDAILKYPMGNGLGGGGTSLPYFLQGLVVEAAVIENEYGRIALEQGIPGLLLWLGFLVWLFGTTGRRLREVNRLGARLAWLCCVLYFGVGMLGMGLLTSIPHTILLLVSMGWLSAITREPRSDADPVYATPPALTYQSAEPKPTRAPALR